MELGLVDFSILMVSLVGPFLTGVRVVGALSSAIELMLLVATNFWPNSRKGSTASLGKPASRGWKWGSMILACLFLALFNWV